MALEVIEARPPVWLTRGREAHVEVKDTGSRVGVAVREFITDEAYTDRDRRVVVHKGDAARKQRECYVGPDGKRGLSILDPSAAYALAEELVAAAMAAEVAMAERYPEKVSA